MKMSKFQKTFQVSQKCIFRHMDIEVHLKNETLFRMYTSPHMTFGGHMTSSRQVKKWWTEEETEYFLEVIKDKKIT